MCAQCTHLCTALGRGRCRASQGLGSCRHHFRAEFYGFSWVPLLVTQSLRLEIYFPFLFYSPPVFPTFNQLSLGSLGPKPTARMPAPSRAHLPSASHTVCMQLIVLFSQADPGASLAPRGDGGFSQGPLLLLLHMTLLHPNIAGALYSSTYAQGTVPSRLTLISAALTPLPTCQFPGQPNMLNHRSA